MSKKSARVATKSLSPKAAICKEPGCFDTPSLKGYCRLHFLKVLAGKSQGDAVPRGRLKGLRDERRSNDRTRGLDPHPINELEMSDRVQGMSELDMDLGLSELNEIDELKKVG